VRVFYGLVVMAVAGVVPPGGAALLLEREAQVAALETLAHAARSGGGRFVIVEGGAGIGKTRLLAEARAVGSSAGMRVLVARGGEFEGGFGFGIVRQLFEPLVASASSDFRSELFSGPAALVEPLLGASRLAVSQDARRGLVRDPARPVLARGQRGLSAADADSD
jgi:AAA ATPase domain